jgi:hypothetical protein
LWSIWYIFPVLVCCVKKSGNPALDLLTWPGWPDWENWAIVYFNRLFFNDRSSANLWDIFFHGTSCVLIGTKNGWDTFWAIFSQTHLVTLIHGSLLICGHVQPKKMKDKIDPNLLQETKCVLWWKLKIVYVCSACIHRCRLLVAADVTATALCTVFSLNRWIFKL